MRYWSWESLVPLLRISGGCSDALTQKSDATGRSHFLALRTRLVSDVKPSCYARLKGQHVLRLLFVFLTFIIAGCSQHAAENSGDRVAAVVNGVEITQREVDAFYKQAASPGASESTRRAQRRMILAKMVQAELLAQEGAKMKLDKSQEFLITVHEARRRVLAGLAEKEIFSTAKPVSPATFQKMFADNPMVFAARKLFVYEEVLFSGVNVSLLQSLDGKIGKGSSLKELLDEITLRGIPFRRTIKTATTDQIEPAILKVLSNATPKVPAVVQMSDKYSMILMLHMILPAPLEGQAAVNQVNARQRNLAFEQKMKDLVDASKITYLGEFKPGAQLKPDGVTLPTGDPARLAAKRLRHILFAGSLAISFVAAMLLLSVSMSILKGTLWLPQFWPVRKKDIPSNQPGFQYEVYRAKPLVKLILFLVALLSVSVLGYHVSLLWDIISFWMIAAAIIGGILVGAVGSRLFTLPFLRRLIQTFRWVPVAVFILLLVIELLETIRIINT